MFLPFFFLHSSFLFLPFWNPSALEPLTDFSDVHECPASSTAWQVAIRYNLEAVILHPVQKVPDCIALLVIHYPLPSCIAREHRSQIVKLRPSCSLPAELLTESSLTFFKIYFQSSS